MYYLLYLVIVIDISIIIPNVLNHLSFRIYYIRKHEYIIISIKSYIAQKLLVRILVVKNNVNILHNTYSNNYETINVNTMKNWYICRYQS